MFHIELADPETRTGVTLEEGLPGINGCLTFIERVQDMNRSYRTYFSEQGLRTLARSALALADQVRQTAQYESEKARGKG